MPKILFTQYMRPDGRKVPTEIDRPIRIHRKAIDLMEIGCTFESEVLTTGEISLTVAYEGEDIAIEICPNGPEVLDAVDKLILSATTNIKAL